MEIDLRTCSASALADHVLQQRFGGNVAQCKQFFLNVIESFPSSTTRTTPEATDCADTTGSTGTTLDFKNPLLQTPLETSLLTPRGGKVSIQLYQNGYLVATLLKTPSIQLVIPASAVSHLILFAKPEDFKLQKTNKVPNAHLVLLKLHPQADILFQSKPVQEQICFALSWVKGKGPTGPSESSTTSGWEEATRAWRQVLEECLGGSHNPNLITSQVQAGPSSPFLSFSSPDQSTTTGGMPFVKCYHGVQDGVLYPLREGILFFKPPKFLPRSDLKSIACGRGSGGQSSSRYVDMVLQRHQDETVEFTNIQREELAVLNQYIHQVLIPAMQEDAKDGSSNKEGPLDSKHNDADDETDDEQPPEEDTDEDDENFVEGTMDTDEEGEEDEEEDGSDGDEDDDDFEVVEDDFAKELAKKTKSVRHNEPRANRSRKRKEMDNQPVNHDDDDSSGVNDGDFEVVQVGSSTESEGEGDHGD